MDIRQDITLTEPTEFRALGKVHVNKDGFPFYVFNNPRGFTFTLPPGTYTLSEGYMVKVGPAHLKDPVLPRMRIPFPKMIRFEFAPNPNKCSIDLVRGLIWCDPSIQDLPEFCLTFILFHEIGHYFFGGGEANERKCDEFAAAQMRKRGYNPSQIMAASAMTLGILSTGRKEHTFNLAKHMR